MHIESGSKTGLMEAHQFVLIGVWDITQANRLCTCYGVNVVDCVPHRFHAGATFVSIMICGWTNLMNIHKRNLPSDFSPHIVVVAMKSFRFDGRYFDNRVSFSPH